ncbi:MAG: bifunctional folylpolyglutamate synthase/dihydrofolate synthase [Spirochaetes bacterium]|nr:bifunctional folylpolyglutamate synthase/dihydrofolate synthase [Spirochaetota bacterium]
MDQAETGKNIITTVEGAFRYIDSFTNLERGITPEKKRLYRLDRMNNLLAVFNNPQNSFKSIHVAGTKGKGSTAAIIANILSASGKKTGLFMSPHVSSPAERISIPGREIDEKLFTDIVNRIALKTGKISVKNPTTFELLVLAAFLYFKESSCEYAVIETGIGGRLDATNVIRPAACILTPVDIEHTEILGSTIEEIAAEKAGIIKKEVPVFCGFQPDSVKDVFKNFSADKGAPIRFLDEELVQLNTETSLHGTVFSIRLKGESTETEFRLSMPGKFQAENAALAYLSLKKLFSRINNESFTKGFKNTFLPGRFEVTGSRNPIILDGAHTPLSIKRLLETFVKIFPEKGVLIFGSVKDKNHREMAKLLYPYFRNIIVSTPGAFKESDPEKVHSAFTKHFPEAELITDPAEALSRALLLTGSMEIREEMLPPILVTGSFYMVAEIRRLLSSD